MLVTLILAVPMAVVWMIVTSSVTPGSFSVGFLLGFAILFAMKGRDVQIKPRRLPDQLAALTVYTITLGRDIWLSSVDVAKRVLDPSMPLQPGIITVYTQDEDESDFTAAFSAHGITITPGELVVDFDGSRTMYVHCLDAEASARNAAPAQAKRLKLLRRIVGRD
jgi:multicomponent Na+:H+ antiporter subunit E